MAPHFIIVSTLKNTNGRAAVNEMSKTNLNEENKTTKAGDGDK